MPGTRRRTGLLPVLLATVLTTACGSTVQVSGTAVLPGGDGLGGTAPGSETLTSTTGGSLPGTGTGTTGSGVTPGGSTGGGGSSTTGGFGTTGFGGGSGSTGGLSGGSGPGITDKEIYVGIIDDANAGAVNEAAGVGSITSGDNKANTRAIIDDINEHGGVAGRKLVPVYAPFDSTSTQTMAQQFAAVCEKFTRDEPRVFAAIEVGDEGYRQCMLKGGVTILSASLPTMGKADFQRFPNVLEMGYANVERLAAYQVTPLVQQRYFTPWDTVRARPSEVGTVKVGILTYNDKVFSDAVDNILVPALRKLGYDPVVAKVGRINRAADYSSQGAAVQSAQLSFASANVTHVIPFETNGGLSTLFLPTARSQGYYPRYGINTASAGEALLESGVVEPRQYNGSVGFGWVPTLDLPAQLNPPTAPYSNDARRHCLKVMKEHNITFDSGNAEGIALNSCSSLYLLDAGVERTTGPITAASFVRTVEAMGAGYQAAATVGGAFGAGRHDHSSKAYYWQYFGDCQCFRYVGGAKTIP